MSRESLPPSKTCPCCGAVQASWSRRTTAEHVEKFRTALSSGSAKDHGYAMGFRDGVKMAAIASDAGPRECTSGCLARIRNLALPALPGSGQSGGGT